MKPAKSAALATILLFGAGCAKSEARPPQKAPVSVATAEIRSVPFTLTANGTVEPMQSVAIQPQVSGTIVEVAFREGAEVQQGQVLFRIDPRPFQAALAEAEAVLLRDRVQAENSAREAERYASLVQKGYVTQSQADQLAAAAAAQKAVVVADEAAAEQARLNLGYATIRAPISGRTGALLVKAGNVVRAPNPTPLVEINQIQPVLVRFTVPARTLTELQKAVSSTTGLKVEATPTEAESDGSMLAETGTLNFLDNSVDTTTGAILLKARFQNARRALWPGQFLTVTLDLYHQANALTVPSDAVQTGQDGNYVFVVDEKNRAKLTPVTVSRTVGETSIIASGLAPGMRVVTLGQERLSPGTEVEIRQATSESRS
jgi:multidrug efflux system membrane fusion protein